MALNRKKIAWNVLAVLLLVAGLLAVMYFTLQWRTASHFNQSVIAQEYQQAGKVDSEKGVFSKAFDAQQRIDFDTALEAYQLIENSEDTVLKFQVKYNMATLYLQRALVARDRDDTDIAMPLLELSKHLYRQILRDDPQHWNAKYNLERALQLAPDLPEEEAAEEIMPERSPDATGSIEIDRALP